MGIVKWIKQLGKQKTKQEEAKQYSFKDLEDIFPEYALAIKDIQNALYENDSAELIWLTQNIRIIYTYMIPKILSTGVDLGLIDSYTVLYNSDRVAVGEYKNLMCIDSSVATLSDLEIRYRLKQD